MPHEICSGSSVICIRRDNMMSTCKVIPATPFGSFFSSLLMFGKACEPLMIPGDSATKCVDKQIV